jgi:2-amino-4-hydroxy-6-hydroxymethyldihydropteridine diphosphokinase/dihydropteroate synthase
MKYKDKPLVVLALGTNLGNRLENLRAAAGKLVERFRFERYSHVIETEAILPPGAPADWNRPYLNMVIALRTEDNPLSLLDQAKFIETEIGRDMNAPRWAPRIIDIDIVLYGNQKIREERLTIPHKELKNRVFLKFLLNMIGIADSNRAVEKFSAERHFVLYPLFAGILNITPDSFSDGGDFFDTENAVRHAEELWNDGAYIIDIGAQSTRPGHTKISPQEEISRLGRVLERCGHIENISIDTSNDETVKYVLQYPNVKWINDQDSQLSPETLKLIANKNVKLVVMLHGTDLFWFDQRIKYLRKLGIKKHNIIIDPGIGFGKTRFENLCMINHLKYLQDVGCSILVGTSRKSFITAHSNVDVKDRDLETIAASDFMMQNDCCSYLRVHNVKDHMRFFVAKHCLQNAR